MMILTTMVWAVLNPLKMAVYPNLEEYTLSDV